MAVSQEPPYSPKVSWVNQSQDVQDFSKNKIMLLFPLLYAQASCTNYMQLTVALISPFATFVIPFSSLV